MAPIPRAAAVAGTFYPGDGRQLAAEVERCFTSARGPGSLPPRQRAGQRFIRAAIVPHAGLVYSGEIAARAFHAIAAEAAAPEVLLLGVNHTGRGAPAAVSRRAWETPLGPVAMADRLIERLDHDPIEVDEEAHAYEHSLEVELPFLQYVLPAPHIAALSVSHGPFRFLEEVAAIVRQAVEGHPVLLLASTDMSHYLPPEEARRQDRYAIEAIRSRSARRLFDEVEGRSISMCGIAPTTVLLAALADEPLEVSFLGWGHSGEVEPMREVVGYAAFLLQSASPL